MTTPQEIVDARHEIGEATSKQYREIGDLQQAALTKLRSRCANEVGHLFDFPTGQVFPRSRCCLFCGEPEPRIVITKRDLTGNDQPDQGA